MAGAEPTSVLEALQTLERDGYTATIELRADGLHCGACDAVHTADRADVERVYRFEGPSDPDEEAVVYAIRCGVCGAGGTLVSAFGPGADPEIADRLVMLDARFRGGAGSAMPPAPGE